MKNFLKQYFLQFLMMTPILLFFHTLASACILKTSTVILKPASITLLLLIPLLYGNYQLKFRYRFLLYISLGLAFGAILSFSVNKGIFINYLGMWLVISLLSLITLYQHRSFFKNWKMRGKHKK